MSELMSQNDDGQIIHCDAGPRVVRAYPIQPAGAGYQAATTNILTTSDTWFRPSDVCVAPDGSIFVTDWYSLELLGTPYVILPHGSVETGSSDATFSATGLMSPGSRTLLLAIDDGKLTCFAWQGGARIV